MTPVPGMQGSAGQSTLILLVRSNRSLLDRQDGLVGEKLRASPSSRWTTEKDLFVRLHLVGELVFLSCSIAAR